MSLLLVYFFVSLFFSFLCSILEAVLLSVTPTFLNVKKQEGKSYAKGLEKLKKDVDKPLIAILTLNTIAHTAGAIGVGSQANIVFGTDSYTITVVSTVMTLAILVFSEIIPKTIGATYWKKLAAFTTRALTIIIWPMRITGTLWLLQLTTRLIGGKSEYGSVLSREDFQAMAELAQEEGVVEEKESAVIRNMLEFRSVLAKDIMTPRIVISSADETCTISQYYEEHTTLPFSRVLIYSGTIDHVTGYFLKDSLLEALVKGEGDKPLSAIKREILIVDEGASVPDLFDKLIEQREHIAIVVDEYGATSGLLTQEDVIETLLGFEIMDESDDVADLQELARRKWKKRAKKMGLIKED